MRFQSVLVLTAAVGLLGGCGLPSAKPGPAPETVIVTQTAVVEGHLTEVAFTKNWTYTGNGGEFQVELTLSRFALGKDAGTEPHPARAGFTAAGTCGEVSQSGLAAGVVKITTTKEGRAPFRPEVFLGATIDHNAMKGNSAIAIMRGSEASCRLVGRLTLGGIDLQLAKPLAQGESAAFPIFIVVQPNNDNDQGPAITADQKRLGYASYNFKTANTENGKAFRVTSGESFTMAETLKP